VRRPDAGEEQRQLLEAEGGGKGRRYFFLATRRVAIREKFSGRKIRFFGKFSVSGATRKVFSGPISDFSVSKFKNSKKFIKTKTGFFRPDFVAFRSDFGAFRAEKIVLAM